MEKCDVLIVGAGPTGLMLSCLLRRLGISIRLMDKNLSPATESRAIGIQARTLELFQNLGIVEKLLRQGLRAGGAEIFLNGRRRLRIDISDMARADTPYPYLLFLSQASTEAILTEHLASVGGRIERGTNLVEFTQDEHLVHSLVKNNQGLETRIQSQFIIGCDGAHSRVRKQLGLNFHGSSYASEFIMADARVQWALPHDKLFAFLSPGNLGVFFPQSSAMSRVLSI